MKTFLLNRTQNVILSTKNNKHIVIIMIIKLGLNLLTFKPQSMYMYANFEIKGPVHVHCVAPPVEILCPSL